MRIAGCNGIVFEIARWIPVAAFTNLCKQLIVARAPVEPVGLLQALGGTTRRSGLAAIRVVDQSPGGKPIVAFDLTEHRVSAQEAAIYAEPNSEAAMADAISTLLDDPARRRTMSEFGARRVRENLVWQHSVPPLLAAYDRVFRAGAAERDARLTEESATMPVAKSGPAP